MQAEVRVEKVDAVQTRGGRVEHRPDESAWSTAIEAAPWVLGTNEPDREVPPEE
jgi:hypothetical protein